MRIALHFPDGSVAAHRLGRIEDGNHNYSLHEDRLIPLDEFLSGMIERAKEEHPDATVKIERLIDNGDGTAQWIPAEDFDPELHTPQGAGRTIVRELTADAEAAS